MKKIIMFVMVLVIGLTAGIANAALLAAESFEYTADAALAGQNGGTGWARPWEEYSDNSGIATIQAGSLVHPTIHFPTMGGHVLTGYSNEAMFDRTIVASILDEAGRQVWISYLFTVETNPTPGNWRSLDLWGGDEFITNAGQPWSTDTFGLLNSDYEGYESGIAITVGQVYWLVVKIEFSGDSNGDNVYLWVDPAPSTEPSTATATVEITDGTTFANDGLDLIQIVAQGPGSYDEIKLGTSFDDVLPDPKNPIVIDPNVMIVYETDETEGDFGVSLKNEPPVGATITVTVDPNNGAGGGNPDLTLIGGSGDHDRITFTRDAGNWDTPKVIRFRAKEDEIAEPPDLLEPQTILVSSSWPAHPTDANFVGETGVAAYVWDNDQADILLTYTPPESDNPRTIIREGMSVKIWEEPRWHWTGQPYDRWRKIGVTLQVPPKNSEDPCLPCEVKLQAEIVGDNLPGTDPCLPFETTDEPNGLIFDKDNYNVPQSIKIWGNDDEQLQASGPEGDTPEGEGDQNYQATLVVTVIDGGGDERYQWLVPEDPEDPCNPNTILVSLEREVQFDIEDNECGAFGILPMDVGNPNAATDPNYVDEDGYPLPDCYVNIHDAVEVARRWLDCSDISDPSCGSYL